MISPAKVCEGLRGRFRDSSKKLPTTLPLHKLLQQSQQKVETTQGWNGTCSVHFRKYFWNHFFADHHKVLSGKHSKPMVQQGSGLLHQMKEREQTVLASPRPISWHVRYWVCPCTAPLRHAPFGHAARARRGGTHYVTTLVRSVLWWPRSLVIAVARK